MRPNIKFQRGFNLIELMIAMVLGLIVSLGITQVFLSAKNTYVTQNAAAGIQEDGRFVLSKMLQEIRMVSTFGCMDEITRPAVGGEIFDAARLRPIDFTTDNARGAVLTLITSDVGSSGGAPTWTVVYDCKDKSVAFTGAQAAPAGKEILPIRRVVYTFLNNQLLTTVGNNTTVLISNVDQFNITFGVAASDTQKIVDKYIAVPPDPGLIRSVRISMVLRDPNSQAASQSFNVVAALRNKVN